MYLTSCCKNTDNPEPGVLFRLFFPVPKSDISLYLSPPVNNLVFCYDSDLGFIRFFQYPS